MAASPQAPHWEAELTTQMLTIRAAEMFSANATWPMASLMAPVTGQVTKKLVYMAHAAIDGLSREVGNT